MATATATETVGIDLMVNNQQAAQALAQTNQKLDELGKVSAKTGAAGRQLKNGLDGASQGADRLELEARQLDDEEAPGGPLDTGTQRLHATRASARTCWSAAWAVCVSVSCSLLRQWSPSSLRRLACAK